MRKKTWERKEIVTLSEWRPVHTIGMHVLQSQGKQTDTSDSGGWQSRVAECFWTDGWQKHKSVMKYSCIMLSWCYWSPYTLTSIWDCWDTLDYIQHNGNTPWLETVSVLNPGCKVQWSVYWPQLAPAKCPQDAQNRARFIGLILALKLGVQDLSKMFWVFELEMCG